MTTKPIINNITLGTVMPFFAYNVDTTYKCTSGDINPSKHGCILEGQPGYLSESSPGNPGERWMRFSSIQTITPKVDTTDPTISSQYPAAVGKEPDSYKIDPTWFTDDKTRNGSEICAAYVENPKYHNCSGIGDNKCGKCGDKNNMMYDAVCTGKITAINTNNLMDNIKKPWYSNPSEYSFNPPTDTEDWPKSDFRGDCGKKQQCTATSPSSKILVCSTSSGGPFGKPYGNCQIVKNACLGTTTGNVKLRGVGREYPSYGSNKDVDIGIAGIIVGCTDSDCQKGSDALNENLQNVGGKYIKEINQDCFDTTKIGYGEAYYGLPGSVTFQEKGYIQNQPSALDTDDWDNKPDNGFTLAVNYTTDDLFASNNYTDCGAKTQKKQPCSYAGGIGNLLYMPPLWPDENKLTSWINSFNKNYIGINTFSATNAIKLPDFLIPWVLTMATMNMMPRYLVTNLFGMYGSSDDVSNLAVQYGILHEDNLGILNGHSLSDAVKSIKTYTDSYISNAFTKWDSQKGPQYFKQLDKIITSEYYNTGNSLSNFLITAGSVSGGMILDVTLPIDVAIAWLDDSQKDLSSVGKESLAYFFGENHENLTRTEYTLYSITDANYILFMYNNKDIQYEIKSESFNFNNPTPGNPNPIKENLFTKVDNNTNVETKIYYSIKLSIKICKPSVMSLAYVLMTNPSFGKLITCQGSSSLQGCGEGDIEFPTTTETCIQTLLLDKRRDIIQQNINKWCSNYTNSYPRSDGIQNFVLNDQSPTCLCYNSHLTTDNSVNENELSLCFSKSCGLNPDSNLRSAYGLTDERCSDDVCASLKSLFQNEVLPPNLEDIDAGRVQKLCNFNPYDRNYSYNKKILLPVLNVSIFLVCLAYILLRKHEEPLTIIIMIILVLTVISGFLLASSPAACVKRSNLPQKRISKCKTPIGIELPEEYCGQKLDYCESSFDTIFPNQGCPSKCCPIGTGCSNICNKDKDGKIVATKGKPTFYTRRNTAVIILSSLLFIGTAIILGILNFKLNKNDKTQYIVSAIILVIMLGLLIRNIVGYKTVASIYGCNATD